MGIKLVKEAIVYSSESTKEEILAALREADIDRLAETITRLDRLCLGWDIVRLYLRNDSLSHAAAMDLISLVQGDLRDRTILTNSQDRIPLP